jgi:hypothetical protein
MSWAEALPANPKRADTASKTEILNFMSGYSGMSCEIRSADCPAERAKYQPLFSF